MQWLGGAQSGSRQARMIWGSAAIFALPMGIIDGWYYTEAQKVVDARAKWDRALRMKPQTAASSDNSYDGGGGAVVIIIKGHARSVGLIWSL